MSTRQITLPKDVRTFQNTEKGQLAQTGKHIPKGTILIISGPVTVNYDHKDDLRAVFFSLDQETRYMLISEIGLPELEEWHK